MFPSGISAAAVLSPARFFYNDAYLLLFSPVICGYLPFCIQHSYFYLCSEDFFCVLHENTIPAYFSLCTVHNLSPLHSNKALNFCSFLCFLSHKTPFFLFVNWHFPARTAIFPLPNCIFACIILIIFLKSVS